MSSLAGYALAVDCFQNWNLRLEPYHRAPIIRLESNNWYRLKRALVIVLETGTTMAKSAMPLDRDPEDLDYDFRPFFLFKPRLEIYSRIDERVESMVCCSIFTHTMFHLVSQCTILHHTMLSNVRLHPLRPEYKDTISLRGCAHFIMPIRQ